VALVERTTDIAILGAGAAGLWAAAVCAKAGRATLVLEKTSRTGTKILASGGSRCNLTTTLPPRPASQLFGPEAARFLSPAFSALPPAKVREHFHALGVPTITEPELEKVFPASQRARDVRNALEGDAKRFGAVIETGRPALDIRPDPLGWRVSTPTGDVTCRALLLCTGGMSYPKSGTTGDGYAWLRALGLEVVHPVPALVPLTSPAGWVTALTGIALDVEASIGRHRRRRPVLFTHTGLSGPAAMDVSEPVARSQGPCVVHLDLLPDLSWEALRERLLAAASQKGAPTLNKVIPLERRVVETVAQQAGLRARNPRVADLDKGERHRLIECLKRLAVPIDGTRGFAFAEVTAGGLALHEVNRKTLQVHKHPGLYVFGELLDLTGPIGGLNFQAAFATAELAARHASAG
jgi:predicted Rossmann fold flavoprotein